MERLHESVQVEAQGLLEDDFDSSTRCFSTRSVIRSTSALLKPGKRGSRSNLELIESVTDSLPDTRPNLIPAGEECSGM